MVARRIGSCVWCLRPHNQTIGGGRRGVRRTRHYGAENSRGSAVRRCRVHRREWRWPRSKAPEIPHNQRTQIVPLPTCCSGTRPTVGEPPLTAAAQQPVPPLMNKSSNGKAAKHSISRALYMTRGDRKPGQPVWEDFGVYRPLSFSVRGAHRCFNFNAEGAAERSIMRA
jgi:hypothetical protein